MASLLIYAGALTYEKVQKSREKKRAARDNRNQLRYSELEKDHAEHLARTTSGREVCFCERGGWDGRTHGEGCARGRLARTGDEAGASIDETRGQEKEEGLRISQGPSSYDISEKEPKGKQGILAGR